MNKLLTISLFLLCATIGFSQPGGGGGLSINHIYDQNLQEIDITKNKDFLVRKFEMKSDTVILNEQIIGFVDEKHIYINPSNSPFNNGNLFRMAIVYLGDTMMIDFINIQGSNGAGHQDGMDSLVFMPGHYSFNRDPKKFWGYNFDAAEKALFNGFTKTSIEVLVPFGIIDTVKLDNHKYIKDVERVTSFQMNKAQQYLKFSQWEKMLIPLNKARENGFVNKSQREEYYKLRTWYYRQFKQLDTAIFYLDSLIQISKGSVNYQYRAMLLEGEGRYDEALSDYNNYVKTHYDQVKAHADRGKFYMNHLKDYNRALVDYNVAISEVESYIKKNTKRIKHSNLYHERGKIYYQLNQKDKAYKDWITLTHKWRDRMDKTLLDSLIFENQKEPELYFLRAVNTAVKSNQVEKEELWSAIKDLQECYKLKYINHLVYYYQAQIYMALEAYQSANQYVSMAINLKPDYAMSYLLKFQIKYKQDWTIDNNKDLDFIKYRELIGKPIKIEKKELTQLQLIDSLKRKIQPINRGMKGSAGLSVSNDNILVRYQLLKIHLADNDSISFNKEYKKATIEIVRGNKATLRYNSVKNGYKERGRFNFLRGQILLFDSHCPEEAISWFKRAKKLKYEDSRLDSLIQLELPCQAQPLPQVSSYENKTKYKKKRANSKSKTHNKVVDKRPEMIKKYKRFDIKIRDDKNEVNLYLDYMLQYLDSNKNAPDKDYKLLVNLMSSDLGYVNGHYMRMTEMDSNSVYLTHKLGVISFKLNNHNGRSGACAWLNTAKRKGADVSNFNEFVDTCKCDYNTDKKKVNPRKTYRYNNFLKRNIEHFEKIEWPSVRVCQVVNYTLKYDNTKRRKRLDAKKNHARDLKKRQKKKRKPNFKNNIIAGGQYEFIVKLSGDTIPQKIFKNKRNSRDYLIYDVNGNLKKRYLDRRTIFGSKRREYSGNTLVSKTWERATWFRKKVMVNGGFSWYEVRMRKEVHLRTVSYDHKGKKRSVRIGEKAKVKKRFKKSKTKKILNLSINKSIKQAKDGTLQK
jgi:tetratricopeptide (TPR) repeat protein